MTPTTTQNQTIEIREATSGAERAQAAGVWLRGGGSRGSDAPSAPVLVAYVDGTPRAVAQVHTNRFGVLGLRRFFVIPEVDRTAIHDAFVDYAQRGEEAPREHSLRASATPDAIPVLLKRFTAQDETVRKAVRETLIVLSGKDLGDNKRDWERWWAEQRL